MDRITEMLDRLGDLTPAELEELQSSVLAEYDTVEKQDLTRDVVDRMNQLGDAADAVRTESARREAEAAEFSAARDAAALRVRGEEAAADDPTMDDEADEPDPEDPNALKKKKKPVVPDPTTPVEDTAPVYSSDETTTVEAAPVAAAIDVPAAAEAAVVEPTPTPVAIEASAEVVAETAPAVEETPINASADPVETPEEITPTTEESEAPVTAAANEPELVAPADRRPVAKKASVAITAGADIPGITAGSDLPDLKAISEAFVKRIHAMGRTSGGDGEQHTIATITASFPEDRTLRANDFAGNSKKVADVVDATAIVAAGGLCAPVEVRYELFGLGDRGRPVRDALAVFSADRGGIRFITPPVIGDLNGAVSLWTVQDDIDAGTDGAPDPVKPCIRVNCGAEVVVYTDAIPLCLTFGNLGSRTYPELVARHTELGMIWHDRYAETRLLTRIGSLSTSVSAAKKLGAVRDFLVALEKAAAGYRNRHRMLPDAPLRVLLPEWFKNMLRADLAMQLPGDGEDGGTSTLGVAESMVNAWFAVRHINATFFLDGETGQILGAQAAGALNDFPAQVVWYLFAEGTFLFLDGGTLDLGLVRDSTLNGTNDYKIFLETFEGVAKVGVEALRVTSTLQVNGATAATISTAY